MEKEIFVCESKRYTLDRKASESVEEFLDVCRDSFCDGEGLRETRHPHVMRRDPDGGIVLHIYDRPTREQVQILLRRALAFDDQDRADLCERALSGDLLALADCADIIERASAAWYEYDR